MSDKRLRELERADPGSPELLRELQRTGRLTEEKLRLMAFCGHPGAKDLCREDIEIWKDAHVLVSWCNNGALRNHMQQWSKALMSLAPIREDSTSQMPCQGPGGALGTAIREARGRPHPNMCICGSTGYVDREIGGIWLGVLALTAAAKVALPYWARKQRRDCEGTGKRPILNHMDNTPTGKFDKWPCWCCEKERVAVEKAEVWLADPQKKNEPKTNDCGGDWGNMTEAWGGLAPLIWERHAQEMHVLGRSMFEFVRGSNEAVIREAVEKAIIGWALDPGSSLE